MKWPEDFLNKVSLWDLAKGIPLPDESVNMIMCSPPYYSLRSYKLEPSVWGGKKDCEHRWIIKKDKLHSGRGLSEGNTDKYSEREPIPDTPVESAFCSLCSAWRGCLGLEPSFDCGKQSLFRLRSDLTEEEKQMILKRLLLDP